MDCKCWSEECKVSIHLAGTAADLQPEWKSKLKFFLGGKQTQTLLQTEKCSFKNSKMSPKPQDFKSQSLIYSKIIGRLQKP